MADDQHSRAFTYSVQVHARVHVHVHVHVLACSLEKYWMMTGLFPGGGVVGDTLLTGTYSQAYCFGFL